MSPHGESALVTDLYEITMLQAYFLHRMNETAVFEFFVRQLSGARDFLLAAGLEQVVAYLTDLHFGKEDLQRLRGSRRFNPSFIRTLEDFRFTGEVDAWLEAEEGAQIKAVRTDRV